jgi:hypothetical protein
MKKQRTTAYENAEHGMEIEMVRKAVGQFKPAHAHFSDLAMFCASRHTVSFESRRRFRRIDITVFCLSQYQRGINNGYPGPLPRGFE